MKENYVKVEEYKDFVKDMSNGALLNTNNSALQAYKNQKNSSTKVQQLENKVNSMSDDIKEIKQLLMGLTNNG
jgi:hypothetical protein